MATFFWQCLVVDRQGANNSAAEAELAEQDRNPQVTMNDTSPSLLGSQSSGCVLRPWEGLLIALLAGAIVFAIVQATHPIFRVAGDVNVAMGRPTEEFLAVIHQNDRHDQKHAALYLGCLGLLTAGALSIREALSRRSWLAPFVALPLGAAGGALGGWLGCLILQYVRDHAGQAELKHLVEAQLATALPLGLGIGLGYGVATRSLTGMLKSAAAGLAGGAVAAAIYAVGVSILFPTTGTEVLLPAEAGMRLLWLCSLGGIIGVVIPLGVKQRQCATATSSPLAN